jgi:RHS repeat-associated protein
MVTMDDVKGIIMGRTMAGAAHRLRVGSGLRPVACRVLVGGIALCLLGTLGLSSPAQAQTVTYTYDTGTNGIGRLTGVSDSSGTLAISYDIMGRTVRRDQVVNGNTYTTKTTYDPAGRIQSITYPDSGSSTVSYGYNGPVLDQISESTTIYAKYSGYTAQEQPGAVTFGNNVTTTYTYSTSSNPDCPHDNFRLCTMTTTSAGSTYQQLRYDYDAGGNVSAIVDPLNGNQSFGYDGLDRLTAATGPYGMLNYLYDPIGNMIYNSQLGFYVYPPGGAAGVQPHAVQNDGVNTYTYDHGGNMVSVTGGAGRALTYGPDNRLSSVVTAGPTTTSFVYDDDGNRVAKTVNGVTTVYIGQLYECAMGGSCSRHIVAGDRRIASVDSSSTFYYHTDLNGSTSVMTDQTGALVQSLVYFPYGATFANTGSVDVERKFTGRVLDDSTGLYFFGARYYDPVPERFISPDPAATVPFDPQALNRYSYGRNNPLRLTGPCGNLSVSVAADAGC